VVEEKQIKIIPTRAALVSNEYRCTFMNFENPDNIAVP
jgi:hypothetical protein